MDEPNSPITAHPTTPPTSPPPPDTPPSNNSTPVPTSVQTQLHAQQVSSHTPIPTNNSSQTVSTHLMVTRAKAGIFKPLECMNCHVTTTSPLPRSHVHALCDPNWKEVMLDEYNALITNGTWVLVPRPTNVNVVHSMWLFKHKFHTGGTLSRYKARLVANRRSQQQVYMHQPPGFVDSTKPDYVCHLQKSLYGLKQAPQAWFQRFATRIGFHHSKTDASLFRIIDSLHKEFVLTDLGSLNYFLGISAQRTASGLFLSQSKFAEEIIEKVHMQQCNPCRTPVDIESKIRPEGAPVADPTLYRSLVGALQYLTFTHPDLSYAVQQVCLYMHDPREPHLLALKRILRYVRGTLDHGLRLHASSMTQLVAYTDADWAGCPVTRRSTSGYCVFLGDNLLSWSAKRQVTLSRYSAEAEYRRVVNVVAETAWIRNLLRELHTPLFTATLVYCDNVSAVYLSTNPVQHQRTKHIEIDIHFVRDYVTSGQVRVLHVPSRFNFADIFTKGLPTALFIDFCYSLNVRRPPAHTAGEY
ncbi:ribonuclease H-like domain-containing protein [Tanacetum coccineum]